MRKTESGRRLLPQVLLVVLLVAAIAASVAGYVYSRYRTDVMLTGGKTSAKTQLASRFTLLLNDTEMEEDGSYRALPESVTAESNYLIPGTTIPQSPVLSIEGKSSVACYLYVEVISEGADDKSSCQMTDDWTLLEDVRGKNGGAVYVYQNGKTLTDSVGETFRVNLLTDGIQAEKTPATRAGALSFCGYLIQVTEGTPAEVFQQKLNKN